MSTSNRGTRYDEDFKRTLVNLYQSGGKTQAAPVENTAFLLCLLTVGSNNIQPSKPTMAKFLPQNR